jgi:hypothetical protein
VDDENGTGVILATQARRIAAMFCNNVPKTTVTRITPVLFVIAVALAYTSETARAEDTWKLTRPIVTYYAGPGITDQSAQLMKDGGWNLIWCTDKDLDIAQKLGLKAMLRDDLLSPATMDTPAKIADLEKLIDRVKNHPALDSYFIVDEPNASVFPSIGKIVALLRQRDPAHFAYVNLFPTYASNEQLGTTGDTVTAYQQYLDRFIAEVKPLLLSYDNYQFFSKTDGNQYFLNMELVRKTALRHNLPFLNIIQASSWSPMVRVPTADELRFLTYTTLAYGGQGLSHYVYNYPVDHKGMIVDNDGKPTHLYHAAKILNPEFERIAGELMPYKSLGAYHVGSIPPGTTALPETSPFKIRSADVKEGSAVPLEQGRPAKGFVLGCFGKAGAPEPTHVVVVNLDYTKPVKATLTGPGKMELFAPSTRTWSSASDKSAELDLLPGGGVLVRLIGSK